MLVQPVLGKHMWKTISLALLLLSFGLAYWLWSHRGDLYGIVYPCSLAGQGPLSNRAAVGTLAPFVGEAQDVPTGWLPCDGRSLEAAAYPELSFILKEDSQGLQFRLPDYRGFLLLRLRSRSGPGGMAVGPISGKLPQHLVHSEASPVSVSHVQWLVRAR